MEQLKLRAGLHTKMNKIRADVTHIEKNGLNEKQRYKYATEADTAHAIRLSMIANGISLMFSSTYIGERIIHGQNSDIPVMRVRLSGAWVDCETGFAEPFEFDGEGMDSGDKAIYKAHTGAEKYLLLKTFLLPTGDDPEKDDEKPTTKWPENKPPSGKSTKPVEPQKEEDAPHESIEDVLAAIDKIDNLPHLEHKRKKLQEEVKNGTWKLGESDKNRLKVAFQKTGDRIKSELNEKENPIG